MFLERTSWWDDYDRTSDLCTCTPGKSFRRPSMNHRDLVWHLRSTECLVAPSRSLIPHSIRSIPNTTQLFPIMYGYYSNKYNVSSTLVCRNIFTHLWNMKYGCCLLNNADCRVSISYPINRTSYAPWRVREWKAWMSRWMFSRQMNVVVERKRNGKSALVTSLWVLLLERGIVAYLLSYRWNIGTF